MKIQKIITPVTAKALIDLTRENENLKGVIDDIFMALIDAKRGVKRDSLRRFRSDDNSGNLSSIILMEIRDNVDIIHEHFDKQK